MANWKAKVYRREEDGKYDVQVVSPNGKVVFTTHRQGYERKGAANSAVNGFLTAAAEGRVVVEEV